MDGGSKVGKAAKVVEEKVKEEVEEEVERKGAVRGNKNV